jgi:signal transduction histidine kinase
MPDESVGQDEGAAQLEGVDQHVRDSVFKQLDAARSAETGMLRSVRTRLVLWSGTATLVVLVLLGLAILLSVRDALVRGSVAEAEARANAVAGYLERGGRGAEAPLAITMTGRGSSTYAFLAFRAPSGQTEIRQSSGFAPPAGPLEDAIEAVWTSDREVRELTIDGSPWRVLTVRRDFGPDEFVIQVFQDRSAEQRAIDTLVYVLVVGGLLALVGAMLVGAVYAGRALVPIRRSLAAQRAALRRQREFAADASHELRTPLTVVRASVEDLRRHPEQRVAAVTPALDDIDAEVAHLTTLVDDLLLLARADSGALDLALQPVELGDLATEASAALAAPAAGRGVTVRVDPEPAVVSGDPVRLRQLVTILVDNAVRHSPAEGVVDVAVRRERDTAVLTVADEGPGIPSDDLARVFDRFWRGSGESTEGTGLGLSIAAAIVTRHAGRIGVANRDRGGAAFTVVLPLATSSAS